MSKTVINAAKAPAAVGPYSHANAQETLFIFQASWVWTRKPVFWQKVWRLRLKQVLKI